MEGNLGGGERELNTTIFLQVANSPAGSDKVALEIVAPNTLTKYSNKRLKIPADFALRGYSPASTLAAAPLNLPEKCKKNHPGYFSPKASMFQSHYSRSVWLPSPKSTSL